MKRFSGSECTAIVVARAGSRRLPSKAMLPFAGTTLIGHKVDQLINCHRVDDVIVGSDSDEILDEARAHGAMTVKRDDFHCDESKCSANQMISNMLALIDPPRFESDLVLWAHPTNPLITPRTYDAAIERFLNLPLHYDSLVSVNEIRGHAWHRGQPVNHQPYRPVDHGGHQVAADLQPVYFQNGAIFIQTHVQMKANSYFHGNRPFLFVTPPDESIDIDTADDYVRACAKVVHL